MANTVEPSELHGRANGSAAAARASEAVAHGRAHLDYQRRIATAGVHRDDARMVTHDHSRDPWRDPARIAEQFHANSHPPKSAMPDDWFYRLALEHSRQRQASGQSWKP